MGAPIVQNNVAVGMVSRLVSEKFVIFYNLYRGLNEIREISKKRTRRSKLESPRRRVKYDPCLNTLYASIKKYFLAQRNVEGQS